MVFITIILLLFITRLLWNRKLPWKLFSVSTMNFVGVLMFVGLGLEYNRHRDIWASIGIITIYYLFLVIGEYAGQHVNVDCNGYEYIGNQLLKSRKISFVLFIFFLLYSTLPIIQFSESEESLVEKTISTWSTYGIEERSDRLIEYEYGQATEGVTALITAVQRQLIGFSILGMGVVFTKKPKFSIILLFIYLLGTIGLSEGTRSSIFIAIGFILILIGFSFKDFFIKHKLMFIFLLVMLCIGLLLLLDTLLLGRQGYKSQGTLQERIDHVIESDFAYGGFGLDFALNTRPASIDTGIDYSLRLIYQVIPRFIWRDKPTIDPNWEMTEQYYGTALSNIGSIKLFTPLGEALYYYGYPGLVIIPFLYGLLTSLLERVYSTSKAYQGLLAQTYIWAFLGMRHTLWNLFGALIVLNFSMLLFLLIYKSINYNLRTTKQLLIGESE